MAQEKKKVNKQPTITGKRTGEISFCNRAKIIPKNHHLKLTNKQCNKKCLTGLYKIYRCREVNQFHRTQMLKF